jgi:hypothetical protein
MKALMVLTPHEKLGKLSVALLDALGKYRQNATMAGLHLTALLSRRSGSATAAWEVSPLLGLLVTVWAAISALIISQVIRLHDTQSCSMGRICGSLLARGRDQPFGKRDRVHNSRAVGDADGACGRDLRDLHQAAYADRQSGGPELDNRAS